LGIDCGCEFTFGKAQKDDWFSSKSSRPTMTNQKIPPGDCIKREHRTGIEIQKRKEGTNLFFTELNIPRVCAILSTEL
jgi:hypothetical protein